MSPSRGDHRNHHPFSGPLVSAEVGHTMRRLTLNQLSVFSGSLQLYGDGISTPSTAQFPWCIDASDPREAALSRCVNSRQFLFNFLFYLFVYLTFILL